MMLCWLLVAVCFPLLRNEAHVPVMRHSITYCRYMEVGKLGETHVITQSSTNSTPHGFMRTEEGYHGSVSLRPPLFLKPNAAVISPSIHATAATRQANAATKPVIQPSVFGLSLCLRRLWIQVFINPDSIIIYRTA